MVEELIFGARFEDEGANDGWERRVSMVLQTTAIKPGRSMGDSPDNKYFDCRTLR